MSFEIDATAGIGGFVRIGRCARSSSRMLLAAVCLTAVSAFAGESVKDPAAVLRLPTTAGQVVADVVGGKPLQVAPVEDAARLMTDSEGQTKGLAVLPAPRFGSRPAWKLRGWLAPEEFVAGREETGIAADTWSIDSWRVDAAIIRTF